jgi:hypothetical protein
VGVGRSCEGGGELGLSTLEGERVERRWMGNVFIPFDERARSCVCGECVHGEGGWVGPVGEQG